MRKPKSNAKLKLIRLTLAGFLTATICFFYYYLFQKQDLFFLHRCLKGARLWYSCFYYPHSEFTTEFFGMKYEGDFGSLADLHIIKYGAYEKRVLYFLREVMQSEYSNRGVFIDVGANTGQHSMFMSRYATKVHAFEPYEPVLKRFRKMIEMNKLSNITVHPIGLGNENAKLPFFKPPDDNPVTGSFVAGFKPQNTLFQELEIRVGDEVLNEVGITSVALIKMDIEGFEKPALQGLRRTLMAERPVVVFEMTIDLDNPVLFRSKEDLRKYFPPRYEFLVFEKYEETFKCYECYTGYYQLVEIDQEVRFDLPSQYDLVAYPVEISNKIPRAYP